MNQLAPVSEIMTKTVITVSPNDTLLNVEHIFEKHKIHHIPVVEEGKVVGLVSKADYNKSVPFFHVDDEQLQTYLEQVPVKDVMIKKIATINANERLDVAALIFNENYFHALPVVNEKKELLGIITTFDLLKEAYPITKKAWK